MSSDSYWHLNVVDKRTKKEVRDEDLDIELIDGDTPIGDLQEDWLEMWWYDRDSEMYALSTKYPDYFFMLECDFTEGRDTTTYLNGKEAYFNRLLEPSTKELYRNHLMYPFMTFQWKIKRFFRKIFN